MHPTEAKPGAPKTPKHMPHAPKVCVRLELEEGGKAHRDTISTNNTQEMRKLNSLIETTVEFTPPPSKEVKMEMEGQESEEEVKEGNDKFCKEMNAQEKLDNQIDDKKELENETHRKDNDEQQD